VPKRVETWTPPWVRRRPENRPSSHGRGYGSVAWQRVRLAVIARDQVCQMCGTVVFGSGEAHIDHIETKPRDEAAEATPIEGLRLLCRSCHSKRTASGS
jgi:5-methylcytosine-specific restriction endonuclease McrA